MNKMALIEENIQNKIYSIRGKQVMLDEDLAKLYQVQTKRINEAVKRNIERFPDDLMFELTDEEFKNLRSQNSTSSWGGRRYNPKVFTEQGVYMLATVLRSKVATDVTLSIMRTFTKMKSFLIQNETLFQKINQIEKRQISYEIKTDEKIDKLFKALENKEFKPQQGIFFDGQIFDAYKFINDLMKLAKDSIILIDNYVDDSVLTLFSKIPQIKVIIYTHTISKQLKQDYEKYKKQYNNVTLKRFKNSHDRFLIIDNKEVYHIGASLKDLGKKWFAFSKMDKTSLAVLDKLQKETNE